MTRPPDEWIGQLYDRCGAALYRYTVMVLADPAAAADAVQGVFVGLLRRRAAPEFDERYLRRAVRNECFNALRRRRRDVFHDDRLRSALIGSRAFMLSGSSPFSFLVRQLDAFAALIAAADRPWPGRIEAVDAVNLWPVGIALRNERSTITIRAYTKSVAEQVKRIRCARLINSTVPPTLVDPLTGKPLEVAACRL